MGVSVSAYARACVRARVQRSHVIANEFRGFFSVSVGDEFSVPNVSVDSLLKSISGSNAVINMIGLSCDIHGQAVHWTDPAPSGFRPSIVGVCSVLGGVGPEDGHQQN